MGTYFLLVALCFVGLMLILLGVQLAIWIEDNLGFWWHITFVVLLFSLVFAALIMGVAK